MVFLEYVSSLDLFSIFSTLRFFQKNVKKPEVICYYSFKHTENQYFLNSFDCNAFVTPIFEDIFLTGSIFMLNKMKIE
jgi:hypothetical protein